MSKNIKATLLKPWWGTRAKKCEKIYKKSLVDEERYPLQWRNDYLLKKAKSLLKNFNINLVIHGIENLGNNGPALLVGNHQDYIDPLAILVALEKQTEENDDINKIATFVGKEELKYHVFTRGPLRMNNSFFLDRDNPRQALKMYKEFGEFVKKNKTYGVVFPEGTRNKEGDISSFKGGALKIAQKELLPIIPFTINNSVQGFSFNRTKKLKIEIFFHKKISPSSFISQNSQALANRVEKIVKSKFKKPDLNFVEIDKSSSSEKLEKRKTKYLAKEAKKEAKEFKREKKEKETERKLIEQEEKELEKLAKKEEKKKNKKRKEKNEK